MWEDTVQVFLSRDNTCSYEEHQNVIANGIQLSSKIMSPMAMMDPKGLPWQLYKTEITFLVLFVFLLKGGWKLISRSIVYWFYRLWGGATYNQRAGQGLQGYILRH